MALNKLLLTHLPGGWGRGQRPLDGAGDVTARARVLEALPQHILPARILARVLAPYPVDDVLQQGLQVHLLVGLGIPVAPVLAEFPPGLQPCPGKVAGVLEGLQSSEECAGKGE